MHILLWRLVCWGMLLKKFNQFNESFVFLHEELQRAHISNARFCTNNITKTTPQNHHILHCRRCRDTSSAHKYDERLARDTKGFVLRSRANAFTSTIFFCALVRDKTLNRSTGRRTQHVQNRSHCLGTTERNVVGRMAGFNVRMVRILFDG